jgi:outer membrane protein TolC
MYRLIIAFFLLVAITFSVKSQEKKITTQKTDSAELKSIKYELPDLNVFIESALKNSPLLKINEKELGKILEEIKMQKKSWMDLIQIDANTKYGLYNQLAINDPVSSDASEVAVQSNKTQLNYFAGITIKIPLSNFTNQKNKLKVLNYSVQESEIKKDQIKNDLTLIVIDEYFKFKNFSEVLDLVQNDLQTMKIKYLKSVKEVENGVLNFSDFAIISASYSKAQESFSKSKNEYYAQFYKLQILTGINIQQSTK